MSQPGVYRIPDVATADDAPTYETDRAADGDAATHLRRAAIDRMLWMNAQHARNAWELRRRDPIAPHGLALLFAQPDPRPGPRDHHRLTAATKLWLAGDEAWDLSDRLFRYYQRIPELLTRPGVDVRTLTNRSDVEMAASAVYIGLGVSSLDTATGSWTQIISTGTITRRDAIGAAGDHSAAAMPVDNDQDVPGVVRILLTDGTAITAERRGVPEFNHRLVRSTHTLNYTSYDSPYPWGYWTYDQLMSDRTEAPVFRWMSALNDLFWQTDQSRLVAEQHSRRRSRR